MARHIPASNLFRVLPGVRRPLAAVFTSTLLLLAPLRAQDITGGWFFTGLAVSADTGPVSLNPDSGIVSGSLTISGDGGGGYTFTPGGGGWLNLAGPAGPIPLEQDGGRFTFNQHEPDTDSDVDTHVAVEWLDDDTALIFYANAESINTGVHEGGLWWLDAFGGVLTRSSLPTADPEGWTGIFASNEIAVSTDTDNGLEVASGVLSVAAGGELGQFEVDGGDGADTFTLMDGGQTLHFLESSGSIHDEAWAVQLGDGRLVYAYFGVENDGTAITFADFGVGILSAVPEPSAAAALAGLGALGAAMLRRRRR